MSENDDDTLATPAQQLQATSDQPFTDAPTLMAG